MIGAYLHHYDFLVRERRAARSLAKRSQAPNKKGGKGTTSPSPLPTQTPPPVDPIELELDRLRGEMGFNQMRRQKPPEDSQ